MQQTLFQTQTKTVATPSPPSKRNNRFMQLSSFSLSTFHLEIADLLNHNYFTALFVQHVCDIWVGSYIYIYNYIGSPCCFGQSSLHLAIFALSGRSIPMLGDVGGNICQIFPGGPIGWNPHVAYCWASYPIPVAEVSQLPVRQILESSRWVGFIEHVDLSIPW